MTTSNSLVLNVRPMTLDDIDALAGWFDSVDDLSFFDRHAIVPMGIEGLRESWKQDLAPAVPAKACWYLAEEPSGRPAAIGGLRTINYINGDAVLPAFVARHARGRGIAVRLGAMMLDVAFDRLRLVRVTSYYRDDNPVSGNVLNKLAFSEEGRVRKALLANGRHRDMVVVGLLREEWLARRDDLNDEIGRDTVLRYNGPGNEQYAWPRGAMADTLVDDLAVRRKEAQFGRSRGTA